MRRPPSRPKIQDQLGQKSGLRSATNSQGKPRTVRERTRWQKNSRKAHTYLCYSHQGQGGVTSLENQIVVVKKKASPAYRWRGQHSEKTVNLKKKMAWKVSKKWDVKQETQQHERAIPFIRRALSTGEKDNISSRGKSENHHPTERSTGAKLNRVLVRKKKGWRRKKRKGRRSGRSHRPIGQRPAITHWGLGKSMRSAGGKSAASCKKKPGVR